MSKIYGEISYLSGEYRPCIIKGRPALFHRWEEKSGIIGPSPMIEGLLKLTVAIIEYEDGVVTECYPHEIRFCDHKFEEVARNS